MVKVTFSFDELLVEPHPARNVARRLKIKRSERGIFFNEAFICCPFALRSKETLVVCQTSFAKPPAAAGKRKTGAQPRTPVKGLLSPAPLLFSRGSSCSAWK